MIYTPPHCCVSERGSSGAIRCENESGGRDRLWCLNQLLQRDPALFLQRHGHTLGAGDLHLFNHLRGDYEVDFHLATLTAAVSPSPEQAASRRRLVKNRRLAGGNTPLVNRTRQSHSSIALVNRTPLVTRHSFIHALE